MQVDLITLWRRRHFRRLLNLIDHLPRNSHFAEAVANDEEHARLLAEAIPASRGEEWRPPMSTWSPEVAMLADLIDAVNALKAVVTMANSQKGARKPDLKPYPRPGTMLEKVRREQRRKAHEELVARVLPNRRQEAE